MRNHRTESRDPKINQFESNEIRYVNSSAVCDNKKRHASIACVGTRWGLSHEYGIWSNQDAT